MPRIRPRSYCVVCQKSRAEVGRISARGKCEACGKARYFDNHDQLIAHHGPMFDHWRQRCVAAFGGVLLDDLREQE